MLNIIFKLSADKTPKENNCGQLLFKRIMEIDKAENVTQKKTIKSHSRGVYVSQELSQSPI